MLTRWPILYIFKQTVWMQETKTVKMLGTVEI